MKNLRKVLALVLVVAMMASLVISASALSAKDYTDYSEVVNKDAVAMLTELGIINGYPAGDFQPAGIVTRAEMAKMIYVVLNSGNDQAPAPDAQRYSDVYKGHWAEGYVAFCDDLGIIDGMGDGTFAPSAPVTGVQAAKMLLVAMGYDSAVEGFTGTNWDYGVLKAASAAGLFEGFTASVNEGCTRDNAALLVYNALIGDCVSYVGNTAVATGDTLIGTCYGLVAVTGVVVANEYANLFDDEPIAAGYTEIAFIGDQYVDLAHAIDPMIPNYADLLEYPVADLAMALLDYYPALDGIKELGILASEELLEAAAVLQQKVTVNDKDEYESFVYNVGTSLAQVGKTVTVYAKLKGNYEQFTNIVEYAKYDMFSGKVVGNVVDDDDCVVLSVQGDKYVNDLKCDDNTRYFENYAAAWREVDGERVYAFDNSWNNTTSDPEPDFGFYFEEGTSVEENVRGERTEYIDVDGDGWVEIVLKTRQTFAVAEYDKYDDEWTFDSSVAVDFDLVDWTGISSEDVVFEGEGELKEGMKVLVMPVDGTYYVKEAATVTGTVEELNYNTDKEYFAVIGGTKYFESGLYWADDIKEMNAGDPAPAPDEKAFFSEIPEDMKAGVEYKCYLDDFGNIVAFEETAMAPRADYFLVTGAAYEDISNTQMDSLVYGAKPATELTVGVEAYTAGRDGRGNNVIKNVDKLYRDTANSIDKAYYINVSYKGSSNFQYVEYQNVFNPYNGFFTEATQNSDPYGDYTNLVKATFSEDDTITSLSAIEAKGGPGAPPPAPGTLGLTDWTSVVEKNMDGKNRVYGTAGAPESLHVGNNTLFYIYLRYASENDLDGDGDVNDVVPGTYNVITVTGYKNLPEISLDAIKTVYGVGAGKPGELDAEAVVIELNVKSEADLPIYSTTNYIYVWNVELATYEDCQVVHGIDVNGNMQTLYVDTYYGELDEDQDVGKWYKFYTSDDAECTNPDHASHVVIGDDYVNVMDVDAQYQMAYVKGIGDIHAGGRYINAVDFDDSTVTFDGKWTDFSKTAVYVYCNDVEGDYNNDELFESSYSKLTDNRPGKASKYIEIDPSTGELVYEWIVIYREMPGPDKDWEAVAIIVVDDNFYSQKDFFRVSYTYAKGEEMPMDGGAPMGDMAPPPAGGPMDPPPMP